MPWGQDESDLVWTNLDLICNPKESKAQRNRKKTKKPKKEQKHQKKNTKKQTKQNTQCFPD